MNTIYNRYYSLQIKKTVLVAIDYENGFQQNFTKKGYNKIYIFY
jgi:hypothetical protein